MAQPASLRQRVLQQIQIYNQQHPRAPIDPAAALAVAAQEGLGGGIGDGGHAFGPFQENNAGGVLTGRFPGQTPQQLQAWASSPVGIQDALGRIGSVAGGEHGAQAVRDIVTQFERPANIPHEIQGALGALGNGGSVDPGFQAGAPHGLANAAASRPMQQLPDFGPQLRTQLLQAAGTPTNDLSGFYATLTKALQARAQQQAAPAVRGGNPALGGTLIPNAATTRAPGGKAGGFLASSSSYKAGRLDQGHDFQTDPGAAILAPGDGHVVAVLSDPHGFGPAYPVIQFTSGPYAGKPPIYVGHTLTQLKPGQQVKAGQPISHTGTSPVGNATVPGWAEVGYAPGGVPGSFGQHAPF